MRRLLATLALILSLPAVGAAIDTHAPQINNSPIHQIGAVMNIDSATVNGQLQVVTLKFPNGSTMTTATNLTQLGNTVNAPNGLVQENSSGQIPASVAVQDQSISSMTASKLRGPLPAIDGSALTNLPGASGKVAIDTGTVNQLPANRIAAGALGSGVIASSVAAAAVLDASIVGVAGSKVSGNISGNAASITGTLTAAQVTGILAGAQLGNGSTNYAQNTTSRQAGAGIFVDTVTAQNQLIVKVNASGNGLIVENDLTTSKAHVFMSGGSQNIRGAVFSNNLKPAKHTTPANYYAMTRDATGNNASAFILMDDGAFFIGGVGSGAGEVTDPPNYFYRGRLDNGIQGENRIHVGYPGGTQSLVFDDFHSPVIMVGFQGSADNFNPDSPDGNTIWTLPVTYSNNGFLWTTDGNGAIIFTDPATFLAAATAASTYLTQSSATATYFNLLNTLTGNKIVGGTFGAVNGSAITALNASALASGTVPDVRLSTSPTLRGNSFNGANQLALLDSSGYVPFTNTGALTGDVTKPAGSQVMTFVGQISPSTGIKAGIMPATVQVSSVGASVVDTLQLVDGAVTSAKIHDAAVTDVKLNKGANFSLTRSTWEVVMINPDGTFATAGPIFDFTEPLILGPSYVMSSLNNFDTSASTNPYFGCARFSSTDTSNSNGVIVLLDNFRNFTSTVSSIAAVRLDNFRVLTGTAADTGNQTYKVAVASVTDNAAISSLTFGNEITVTFTGNTGLLKERFITSPADIVSWAPVFDAASAVALRIRRDGSDASAIDSFFRSIGLRLATSG